MEWRDSTNSYGIVTILLHWLVAITVIGLFASGLWMVELTYYSDWYRTAPALHKSVGLLLLATLLARLVWRSANPHPLPLQTASPLERTAAKLAHSLLYLLLFGVIISGYLISTADGRPIEVFGRLQVPALISHLPQQADRAGAVHLALAVSLIVLAGIHALAALKHHFVDRDRTLMRMLGRR